MLIVNNRVNMYGKRHGAGSGIDFQIRSFNPKSNNHSNVQGLDFNIPTEA